MASTIAIFISKNKTSLFDMACGLVVIDDFPQGQTGKGDEVVIALDDGSGEEGEDNEKEEPSGKESN